MIQTPLKQPRQTPDQRRATAALEALKNVSEFEDFAKTCKKTSSRILTSGLLPALAFLNAKQDGQNTPLLKAISGYLDANGFALGGNETPVERFCKHASPVQLRRAQTEALAYLDWLARFADARKIKDKAEKGKTE